MTPRITNLTSQGITIATILLLASCAQVTEVDISTELEGGASSEALPDYENPIEPTAIIETEVSPLSSFKKTTLFGAFARSDAKENNWLQLSAVNVGAGNCILVSCPNSQDQVLLDCGTVERDKRRRERRAMDFVAPKVKTGKTTVIASHADQDHTIFLPVVLKNADIHSVWLGNYLREFGNASARYSVGDWIAQQQRNGKPVYGDLQVGWDTKGRPVRDLQCEGVDFLFLTVNVGKSKNSRSLVTLLRYGDFQAIFPGDAETETVKDVLANFSGVISGTTLLFSEHHGAHTNGSNKYDWINQIRPQIVVYSSGTKFNHPSCESVENYRQWGDLMPASTHGMRCRDEREESNLAEYVTESSGIVTVATDGKYITVSCSDDSCELTSN